MKLFITLILSLFFIGCNRYSIPKIINQEKYSTLVDSYYSDGLKELSINEIFILDFNNDAVDFANKLYSNMNNIYWHGKKYFKVERRDDLALVYDYYKKLGGDISSGKYLINGKILYADFFTNEHVNEKVDYENCLRYNSSTGKCELYPSYDEICTDYNYKLGVKMIVRNLLNSTLVYDKYYEDSKVVSECNKIGDKKEFPLLSTNLSLLSDSLAKRFVNDLMPKKKILEVSFLTKNDIYYSDEEINLLDNALKVFKSDKKKAKSLFEDLVKSTNSYSSVALYDLGLYYEDAKDFSLAKKYYEKAFKVASSQDNINENIISSFKRVERTIRLMEMVE